MGIPIMNQYGGSVEWHLEMMNMAILVIDKFDPETTQHQAAKNYLVKVFEVITRSMGEK